MCFCTPACVLHQRNPMPPVALRASQAPSTAAAFVAFADFFLLSLRGLLLFLQRNQEGEKAADLAACFWRSCSQEISVSNDVRHKVRVGGAQRCARCGCSAKPGECCDVCR